MIIDKNISPYVAITQKSIRSALNKINANEEGVLVCVDPNGSIKGVLTDGDFRRWVVDQESINLDQPVEAIINSEFIQCAEDTDKQKIISLFSDRIRFIPLVDKYNRLVALARPRDSLLNVDGRIIGADNPAYLIAEIGNNHNGSFDLACELVDKSIESGANCAKFQMRNLESLYSVKAKGSDASIDAEDLGSQYTLDLLTRYQLSNDELLKVFDYCHSKGITPLCTPWDEASLEVLEAYGMAAYKVASADFTNHDLLRSMAQTGKPLICSTGMTTGEDIRESINILQDEGAQYALLHCNSTYPAPFKDINLRYMKTLREIGQCAVGYSSHDRGINIAVAAVALGAAIIEKHFTLDRNMEGNDHRVSLLPDEFNEMKEAIRQVELALGGQTFRNLSQGEVINRETLGKSLWVNVELKKGDIIKEEMIDVKSPGSGLQPNMKKKLIGKVCGRDMKAGDVFHLSDVEGNTCTARDYKFNIPFGIPVRYHDFKLFQNTSNFDVFEFHLSYKDLEADLDAYLEHNSKLDLIVHSPELFAGDHILDLCSTDDDYRNLSIKCLNQVADKTRDLKHYFPKAGNTKIIVNAGGFSLDKPMDLDERYKHYELINNSLNKINQDGIEIIMQTMPPFPWHFGGQRFHNLFIDADEIVSFCEKYGYRVCFDVSHSKLACNHFKWSFSHFVQKIAPYSAHLHIADASGVDGEGLQIGDGEIDFVTMCSELMNHGENDISFIPEVWQGHKDNGKGFWQALDKLQGLL